MDILFSSLYQIDHNEDLKSRINIEDSGNVLTDYTDRLLEEITSSGNRRRFVFRSDTTELRVALKNILDDEDRETAAETNVDRLLSIEADAQEEYRHLDMEIPKGSLFQVLIDDNGTKKIIVSKADHNEFVDDQDFTLHKGLPWRKRVFKAVLVVFDEDNNVSSVYVYDTGSRISTYWWKYYLELTELYNNSHNTTKSLDMLDKKVFGKIKDKYPADHFILRNSTVGHFKSNEQFTMDTYLDQIWNNYDPVDANFPKDKLIERIKELPDKWGFDSQFEIESSDVNKRMLTRVPLTDGLELHVKDYIENIEDTIFAEKDDQGNKFIKIKSDLGYDRFKGKS